MRKTGNQRITSYQIAAACEVSQPTVSRILSGRTHRYRPATCRLVLDTAARLGYRPNAAARITRTGRFGTMALLLSTRREASNVAPDLLNGIADVLNEHGQNLLLVKLPDEEMTADGSLPRILREHAADGLLIDYTHAIPASLVALIDRLPQPSVWINSRQPANCVRPDDYGAGRRGVELLLTAGHRAIAYADFGRPDHIQPHYSVMDRLQGYRDAMMDAGLQPRVLGVPIGPQIPGGDRVAYGRSVLTSADRPSAVLCHSFKSSLPLQMGAMQLGLRVPDDLSLLTFDDHPVDFAGPPHTTLRVPHHEVGRQAAVMLLDRLAQPGDAARESTIPFELAAGATVCRPARTPVCTTTGD